LMIPDTPPTATSTAGGSGGMKRLNSSGDIHLTDQRVHYYSPAEYSALIVRRLCVHSSSSSPSPVINPDHPLLKHSLSRYGQFCRQDLSNPPFQRITCRLKSNPPLEDNWLTEQRLRSGSKIKRCSSSSACWRSLGRGLFSWRDKLLMMKRDCVSVITLHRGCLLY
jgi:hypothetical protein